MMVAALEGVRHVRGKGASAYEEGIRVPLMVKDPRSPYRPWERQ